MEVGSDSPIKIKQYDTPIKVEVVKTEVTAEKKTTLIDSEQEEKRHRIVFHSPPDKKQNLDDYPDDQHEGVRRIVFVKKTAQEQ